MRRSHLIRDGYNLIAEAYASKRDQASSLPYLERLAQQLAENSLILDLGCGAGCPVDRWLVDRGHRVIGFDISDEMLALARKNVPDAIYHCRDMASLQRREVSVDAVVCFFALFHVDRRSHLNLFQTVRSCLPTGGAFLLTTGRSDWEGEDDFLGVPMAWSHFDSTTTKGLLETAGFSVLFEDLHRGNRVGKKDTYHPIFLARAV